MINCPKVSVCVITYNQENYIRDCLQSIVDQVTNFEFEVIIGDDCSTDGTGVIVSEFLNLYPNLIKVIWHRENVGPTKNYMDVHGAAWGEYVCHCDGDDYWFADKLQKQADYLDQNRGCNVVWHRVKIENPLTGYQYNDFNSRTNLDGLKFTRRDILLIGSIGCHSAKMYRRFSGFSYVGCHECLDFYTDVLHVGNGYSLILNDYLGVYRLGIGVSDNLDTKRLYFRHLRHFYNQFPEYRAEIAANAFIVFMADIKNCRSTWYDGYLIWRRVSFLKFLPKVLRLIKILTNFRSGVC